MVPTLLKVLLQFLKVLRVKKPIRKVLPCKVFPGSEEVSLYMGKTFQSKNNKTGVPSMIHSVRPTFTPVAITFLAWTLFGFARFWRVGTDVQTKGRKLWSLPALTVGQPSSWINLLILVLGWKIGIMFRNVLLDTVEIIYVDKTFSRKSMNI